MLENIDENNKFGGDYFLKVSNDLSNVIFKEEFDLVMKLLPPKAGDKILDLGCGKGLFGLFLLSKEKCDMTFSDISPEASKYLSNYKFVQCSMTDTPFPDNSFDKIYSSSTISHIDDVDKAIKEIFRISKGEILLTTNNKWCVYYRKLAYFLNIIPNFKYDKTALKLYSERSLRKLLKKNGWKIKHVLHYGEYIPSKLKLNFFKTRLMIVASKY